MPDSKQTADAKLLVIDTASPQCAALVQHGDQVFEYVESEPRQHAEKLLALVDGALAEAKLTLHELDAIAVNRGPGAFTSLRIGISVTQALAFAHDKPVLLLSSLAAWAESASRRSRANQFWVLLDARMNEGYEARYQQSIDGRLQLMGDEKITPLKDIDPQQYSDFVKIGTGWPLLVKQNEREIDGFNDKAIYHPRSLMTIAQQQWLSQELVTAAQTLPVYLREKVAEKMAA